MELNCFKLYTIDDMLNFDLLDESLGIVSPAHSVYDVYDFLTKMGSSCYILLTDQISLSGCLYVLRYRTICVLQLFVNQVVKS